MVPTWLVLLLCAVGAICDEPGYIGKSHGTPRSRPNPNIINGNSTSISKHPYIAALLVDNYMSGTGVVLNKRWILTTAFNVDWATITALEFRVGSTYYDKGGQVLKATKVIVHPKYPGNGWDYDIAAVQTDKVIKFNKNVKPIKLATKEPKNGIIAWFAGWGYNSNYTIPEHLQGAQLTVYDREKCQNTYGDYLTRRLICTFDTNVAPCSYDFGNPLVYNGKLVGLFAGGYDCYPGEDPVMHTNVACLSGWVKSVINSEEDDQE